jgi:hypothetical protein
MQALHVATWFALSEGDRYTAQGRKAVANSFYNLLPMLADVRKAIVAEPEVEQAEVAQAPAVNSRAAGLLHLVTQQASADEASTPE